MRFVIEPLKTEYKTISVRTTLLESFLQCAYKYRFAPKSKSNVDYFMFGNAVNSVLQTYLYDKHKGSETLGIVGAMYPQFHSQIAYMIQHLGNRYDVVTNELNIVLEIEYGDILFVLSGTMDLLVKNSDGRYRIVDLKTAAKKRDDAMEKGKIQKIIYPFLLGCGIGFDKVEGFEYFILTKHKKPQLQILEYPDLKKDEIIDTVKNIFMLYKQTLEEGIYDINKYDSDGKINSSCRYCPLKGNGCPGFK